MHKRQKTTSDSVEPSESNQKPEINFKQKTWKEDVTFVVEEQELHASKVVLALSSPVFEAMFGSEFLEKNLSKVDLPGKKFHEFEEFLHFLYPHCKKEINNNNLLYLLKLADEYDVKPLIPLCQDFIDFIDKNFSKSTNHDVMIYHAAAIMYNFGKIRKECAQRLYNMKVLDEAVKSNVIEQGIAYEILKDIVEAQRLLLENNTTAKVISMMNSRASFDEKPPPITGFEDAVGVVIRIDTVYLNIFASKSVQYVTAEISRWVLQFSACIKYQVDNLGKIRLLVFVKCCKPQFTTCQCKILVKVTNHVGAQHKYKSFNVTFAGTGIPLDIDLISNVSKANGFVSDSGKIVIETYILANQPVND